MSRAALVALALAACNIYGSSTPPPDASRPDTALAGPDAPPPLTDDTMSCGQPLPTSADGDIYVTATIVAPDGTGQESPLQGASVEIFQVGTSQPLATAITDHFGEVTVLLRSTVPIDAYVHVSSPGYVDTYYYPALPWVDNQTISTAIFARPTGGTPDPTHASLYVLTVGCNGETQDGVAVALDPAGASQITYPDGTATESGLAGAVIDHVTPGLVKLEGVDVADGLPMRGHVVDARAGVQTIVDLSR